MAKAHPNVNTSGLIHGRGWNKIAYKEGDVVGGCLFVRDTETRNRRRYAIFKSPVCDNEFEAAIADVKNDNRIYCGCEKCKAHYKRVKHGLIEHPLYNRWRNMIDRCYNPKNKGFRNYGGRGIFVCAEWRADFKSYYDHVTSLSNYNEDDLGINGLTLDRENNDEGYRPGNLRWVTRRIQNINKRHGNCPSPYVGVFQKGGGYDCTITVHGNTHRIGKYDNPDVAVMDRDMYIIKNGLWEYPLQVIKAN